MGFPLVTDEDARRRALEQLDILDSGPEASFDNLTALAARLFRVPIVLISFLDRDRQWFKSHHGLNVCETSRDVSFCAHAIAANQLLIVPDASKDPRFVNNALVTGHPHIRFYAGMPLHTSDGLAIGTLCLIDSVPRSFSAAEREGLAALATLVMDELELRLSRKQLQVQERHWHALITGISDVITVMDTEGCVQYQSPAVTDVLGCGMNDLVGHKIGDRVHPDDVKHFRAMLRLLQDEPTVEQTFEVRVRHQDGSWRHLDTIGKNCLRDESVQGFILTSRDVTERKQMQERLRLLESVVVHTNDAVIVTEAEPIGEPGPRIIYVNQAFTEMTGYSAEEAMGQSLRFLQGPQTRMPPPDEVREAMEGHRSANFQLLNTRKDGTPFWAEMSISPVVDDDGIVTHWVSIQRDISQSKQAEDALRRAKEAAEKSNMALRESGEQLRLALESGHMGTWERDYGTNATRWSSQAKALYGFRPDEYTGALSVIAERVHPEDRQFMKERIAIPRTNPEFVDEFRVVWPDGSVHWLESRGRLLIDEDGVAKGTLGVVLDVTDRKLDLEGAQLETLKRLARAAEYRDDDTGLHTQRVGHLSRALAQAMGLPLPQVQLIGETAPLHDVGKIGVSDSILLKPGKLTDEEFATMKRHTHIGAGILSGSSSPWLKMAEEIALTHHERWDGRGYMGMEGENIPLVGSIVCVADVFDALTHERPYKKAWPLEEAVAEIASQSGRQFNPRVVEAFMTLRHEEYL